MVARRYRVEGMTCDHCGRAVTAEVGRIPGITEVVVDVSEGTLAVSGDVIDDAAVAAAVDEAGYAIA